MKVLHEFYELKYSGAEIKLRDLAGLFRDRGIESHVLSTGPEEGEFAGELRRVGCRIAHLSLTRRFRFLGRYYGYLRKTRFDVVHIHLEHLSFWVALITRLAGVGRIVRSYHSCFPYIGTVRVTNIIKRWITRRVLGVHNIAISAAVQENEARRFYNPCCLINNGVDLRAFARVELPEKNDLRARLGLRPQELIFIVVGACNGRKRHDDVIRMIRDIKPQIPDLAMRLLHLGTGPLCEIEKTLAGELGVGPVIDFLGNQKNVAQYLQAADIFLMPSENEGLSISLLEAMACGLPVVVSDIPPFRQIIEHDRNGLVVSRGDAADLTARCVELAQSSDLRTRLGANARRTVEDCYSLTKMLQQTLAVYGVDAGSS